MCAKLILHHGPEYGKKTFDNVQTAIVHNTKQYQHTIQAGERNSHYSAGVRKYAYYEVKRLGNLARRKM